MKKVPLKLSNHSFLKNVDVDFSNETNRMFKEYPFYSCLCFLIKTLKADSLVLLSRCSRDTGLKLILSLNPSGFVAEIGC